jgi:hypothetical protein
VIRVGVYTAMVTDVELQQIAALAACTFSPGSAEKRFVRHLVERKPTAISIAQAEWLDKLAHRYRKQIGRCMSVACDACSGMSKTQITERDMQTLRYALVVEANPELDGIYPSSGADAARFRKLVRHELLVFAGMGEAKGKPVALYNITDAGRTLAEPKKRKAVRR